MLTRTGWAVAAITVAGVVAGRLLGSLELFVLGATAGAVLVVAAAMAVAGRSAVRVHRHVRPSRVHAGNDAQVELSVTATGRRRCPAVAVTDRVAGTQRAQVMVGPLRPGGRAHGTYRLTTTHRGVLELGPLRVTTSDPFGLVAVTVADAATDTVVVLPAVNQVPAPPHRQADDPLAGARRRRRWAGGDEFHALRPYATGDDLRSVHWPASARHDELVVRQHDQRWQGRTTVVLDTRAAVHSRASFEGCVSAAASILAAGARRGDLLALRTDGDTDRGIGHDIGTDPAGRSGRSLDRLGASHAHAEHLLEHLATLGPSLDTDHLRCPPAMGGTVVVVTTTAGWERRATDDPGLAGAVVVAFHPSFANPVVPEPDGAAAVAGGTGVLTVTRSHRFTDVWSAWADAGTPATGVAR